MSSPLRSRSGDTPGGAVVVERVFSAFGPRSRHVARPDAPGPQRPAPMRMYRRVRAQPHGRDRAAGRQ
ncbi:hypothetical protein ACFPM0_14635 [Pseudonocardia sulfidoxydans]|uniref:hypothetical protein n=1 Tax=Pseudonocardia sulfidoxydans TaxID=54011 RepID=UPI00361185F0